MQSNLSSQQFQSMTTHLDHCLNALRLLRNEVISVHRRVMENSWESDPIDGEKTLEERLDFINQIYDNLESHAKQLSVSTPMTVQMERLSRFLHDGQIDPHTNELYDKALEASTWMETNNQLLQMYAEFLRTVVGNRRRSIMTDRPISYSNYGLSSSPQNIFEQTLTVVLKDPNIKKIGLVGRYLEKSTLSALVEFKFGQVIDKQYVCLLKMLMVVNSGLPEFVQMIAPHEEWSYLDIGSAQVDIHKESRYLVYRKMSVQANIHLMQTIMPCIDIRNAHTLSYVLNLFAKFSGVFDIKCRVCKRIMKDYLPPLMFDLRCPKNALHESCR
uniref:Mediator complex subunit 27 n=1 Tax=Wuchereria bancrofti TaxID=6293 RepID=A0AAF5PKX9_WUCBA